MPSKNSCTLFVLFEECCKNAGSSVPWISQLRTWAQTEYFTCSLHHVTFNASAISIQWPFCSFCLLVFLNVAFNKKCFIHSNVDIVEDVEKSTLYILLLLLPTKDTMNQKWKKVCLLFYPDPEARATGPSPTPWGTLTSARPGTDFRAYFTDQLLLGIVKLVIWNFFLTSPRHLGGVLGPSPSPWRTPTSARPGTDFRAFSLTTFC